MYQNIFCSIKKKNSCCNRQLHRFPKRMSVRTLYHVIKCFIFLLRKQHEQKNAFKFKLRHRRQETFFLPIHTVLFSDKNRYLSTSVHTCSKKCTRLSLLKTRLARPLVVAYLNSSVSGAHITDLPFHSTPSLSAYSFTSVFGVD